jgi:hypothetical protein
MYNKGTLAEGYRALCLYKKWVESIGLDMESELPLMNVTYRIVYEDKDFYEELRGLTKKIRNIFKIKVYNLTSIYVYVHIYKYKIFLK